MIIVAIRLEDNNVVRMFKDIWKGLANSNVSSHMHDLEISPYIHLITKQHIGDLVSELPINELKEAIGSFKNIPISLGSHFTWKALYGQKNTYAICPIDVSEELLMLQKKIYDIYPSDFISETPDRWQAVVGLTDVIPFTKLCETKTVIDPLLKTEQAMVKRVVVLKQSMCSGQHYSYEIKKANFNLGS